MQTLEITEPVARKVLETIDAGLCGGLGNPVPGHMCVEAAVCYALGLPHGDDPKCVSYAVRAAKIKINDSRWSSNAARAKGLRRLGLIQLGSLGMIDDKEFARRIAELSIRTQVPAVLRAAASVQTNTIHRDVLLQHAANCAANPTLDNALAARSAAFAAHAANAAYAAADAAADAAAYAAHAANSAADAAAFAAFAADAAADAAAFAANSAAFARDAQLSQFAEDVVQILIDMKAPGAKWLALTE